MALLITPQIISEYALKTRCHSAYAITCEMYDSLRVHSNGEKPVNLIEERRPSESEYIKSYREKIYVPITKSNISRVISSLSKIRRSTDWSISFPDKKVARIKKGEELEEFTTKKYPYNFYSLTNWVFAVALKNYLIDPNAVILVTPIRIDIDASDPYEPFPFIYNSDRVLEFVPGEFCVLVSTHKCTYEIKDERGVVTMTKNDGMIIHYIDRDNMITYQQTDQHKQFKAVRTFKHGLGILPAFKVPGVFFEACDNTFINESRIAGMLPHLDEAARIYSDLQAEIVQHVHSEKWLYMNTQCQTCNGTGREIINENPCDCHSCKGAGRVPTSPYSNHVITPPVMGEETIPTPPAGYIQKSDVALMCDKINGLVNEHLYKSLASINMQFLDQSPLNQSGVAKEVDKDELNNFVHSVAEDIVYIVDKIIYITNEYRVKGLIEDPIKRAELLPNVAVPERFDLLSSSFLVDEIADAKSNNINNLIVATLETEYAAKKFYNIPVVAQTIALMYELDPMPALTDEQKIMRLQNDGVTQIDYIISSYIVPFIKRALRDNDDFLTLEFDKQNAILVKYAQEKEKQNSASGKISSAIPEEEEVIEEVI